MNKKLITKAKEILIGVWEDGASTYPTSGVAYERVTADTLSVVQDDATETTHEFETTDTPEVEYTPGAYKVDLQNTELSEHFMTKILGWKNVTAPAKGYVAPKTFTTRYICLQVKFSENDYFFLPKISVAPKLNMESIKTGVVYGTLSGTATNATVGDEETAYGYFEEAVITKATAPTT